jgi:hypothetical protein
LTAGYALALPRHAAKAREAVLRRAIHRPTLDLDDSMARARIKSGGPTRGRLRVLKLGMGSGKILAKGRVKKPKRGKGRS